MLVDTNNSSHRCTDLGYFEWWYLHFISEENKIFNVMLHETDVFGLDKQTYISLSLLSKSGSRYFRRALSPDCISTQGRYLNFEDNGIAITETNSMSNYSG